MDNLDIVQNYSSSLSLFFAWNRLLTFNNHSIKRKSVRFSEEKTSLELWEKQLYYRNSFNLALNNELDDVFVTEK